MQSACWRCFKPRYVLLCCTAAAACLPNGLTCHRSLPTPAPFPFPPPIAYCFLPSPSLQHHHHRPPFPSSSTASASPPLPPLSLSPLPPTPPPPPFPLLPPFLLPAPPIVPSAACLLSCRSLCFERRLFGVLPHPPIRKGPAQRLPSLQLRSTPPSTVFIPLWLGVSS